MLRQAEARVALEDQKYGVGELGGDVPEELRHARAGWPGSAPPRRSSRRKRGRAVYARRKVTVEPVFGQIQQPRGIRQFLLRGIEKVRAEWSLICLTHNLLKLHRAAGTA